VRRCFKDYKKQKHNHLLYFVAGGFFIIGFQLEIGYLVLGIPNVNSICVLCNTYDENVCHLFLTCKTASSIWNLCDNWFVVQTIHHCLTKEHFLGYQLVGPIGREDHWITLYE